LRFDVLYNCYLTSRCLFAWQHEFLRPDAKLEINVSAEQRAALEAAISSHSISPDMFASVQAVRLDFVHGCIFARYALINLV